MLISKIMLIRLEHFRPGCTITPCHGFFQTVRGCDCLIYNGSKKGGFRHPSWMSNFDKCLHNLVTLIQKRHKSMIELLY